MKSIKKSNNKARLNLYLEENVFHWIMKEAEKIGLNEGTFAKTLIIAAYNARAIK